MPAARLGILLGAVLLAACSGNKATPATPAVAKASPKPAVSTPVKPPPAAPEGDLPISAAQHAVASDIPGKSAPPFDASDPKQGERVAIAFRPSQRAIRDKRVTVGVGDMRPRADIYLVYPAGMNLPKAAGNDAIEARAAAWVGPRPEYRVLPAGDPGIPASLPIGAEWVAVFDVPAETNADYIAIEGRHYPYSLQVPVPATPVLHADSTAASAALAVLSADPLEHWRAALAAPSAFASHDPVLGPLAERRSLDAAAAIAQLDPELGRAVRLRMAGVIDLGDGVALPIWPGDSATARGLIRDVLEASEAPRRTLMAQSWLQQQPAAGAIILDDAAAIDPRTGLTFPSVLLVNFTENPAAASATRGTVAEGGIAGAVETVQPELLRIEPLTAITATIGAEQGIGANEESTRRTANPARRQREQRRTVADIQIADWTAERSVVGEIAKCRPPGLSIGPLMADWTQTTFLKAALDPTANAPLPASVADRAVAGRLMFENGRWMIYLEIGNAADPKANAPDMVLYFGPRGASGRGILRIAPDGILSDIRSGAPVAAGKATIVRATDRTSIWVPVPASAIEAGRVLRLGFVFVDGQGRRNAWPRAMLPWQTEPGRIAIDLNSWGPGQ